MNRRPIIARPILTGILGLAVLIGFAALAVFTWRYVVGKGSPHLPFSSNKEELITFDAEDVTGLRIGSEVELKGHEIGRITDIQLSSAPPSEGGKPIFAVKVKIDDEYREEWGNPNKYRMGKLTSETFVSPKIILLIPMSDRTPAPATPASNSGALENTKPAPTAASADPHAPPHLRLETEPDMIAEAQEVVEHLKGVVAELDRPVSDFLKSAPASEVAARETAGKARQTAAATPPSGGAGETTLQRTLSNLLQTSEDMKRIAAAFNEKPDAGPEAAPTVVQEIARKILDASKKLDDTSAKLADFSADLAGPDGKLYKNIDQLTSNLRGFSADLEASNGVLHKRIGDISKNLAKFSGDLNTPDGSLRKEIDDTLAKISKASDHIDDSVTGMRSGAVGWLLNLREKKNKAAAGAASPTPTPTKPPHREIPTGRANSQ
jgi:ABC-type transporter Mla subunit MlaD